MRRTYVRSTRGRSIEHPDQSTALTRLANVGYTPARDHYGETSHLLGHTVVGGPLDNAAFLTLPDSHGIPIAYTVPIEVKNQREWVYARHRELHQLLYKAARLQFDHPDLPIVPVLVCRRRHETTRSLGMQIGFYSIQYRTQLITPAADIREERFAEVKRELGYDDIRLTSDPPGSLIKAFRESVTRDARLTASHWATYAPALLPHFDVLRKNITRQERNAAYEAFREALDAVGIAIPES